MNQLLSAFISGLGRIALIYIFSLILVSCAHGQKHEEQAKAAAQPVSQKISPDAGASIESKQVAAESNAPYVTEIKFAKRQAALSKEMKARLQKIYAQAAAVGQVDVVESFAWSDQDYPGESAPALPKADRALAESRNAAIAQELKHLGSKATFKPVTMTERPSGLNEKLGLGDTRLKKMFEEAGITTGAKNKEAPPKKSRAVVMITLKK